MRKSGEIHFYFLGNLALVISDSLTRANVKEVNFDPYSIRNQLRVPRKPFSVLRNFNSN